MFHFLLIMLSISTVNMIAHDFAKITILTAPIGRNVHQSGGPQSVTTSLIRGLRQIGTNFNFNPRSEKEIGDTVVVLADVNALRQAIQLKSSGRVKKLLAGPNLVVRANEAGGILGSPHVDVCIVPSAWVKPNYEDDLPILKGRIKIWYAGVNTTDWIPSAPLIEKIKSGNKDVLVYWKTESAEFCQKTAALLTKYGFNPFIVKYGSYDQSAMIQILSHTLFSVFITRSESQGIAFVEAWAMDVPTLVWDPQTPSNICGKDFWPISACPYLTPLTGINWQNISELEYILDNIGHTINYFEPRNWTLNNMTDQLSAQLMLSIISEI